MNLSRRISGLLAGITAFCCLTAGAQAQSFSTPPPEIVSAWKHNTEDLVVVFGYDGTYYLIESDSTPPGMERGTFNWNKTSGAFSVNTVVDTNGDAGFSHPGAATTITVSGNTLNYAVPGEGASTFSRVVNTSSAIVGSWVVPGAKISLTFLADGNYYIATEENDFNQSPGYYSGMEKGTYAWNSSTKVLTATATKDANGLSGFSNNSPSSTVNITGNVMTFFDGRLSTTLFRITTKPTPISLPDFTVTRYANYRQSSDATPILRTVGDLSPYSADANINSNLNASAPTLKIGNAAAFPIPADLDEPGSFDFEQEFPTLSALNTFLPASAALQIRSGTAVANLTNAAVLSFPSIPKIIVRDNASWSGSVYRFGDDEVLQWTLPTGFDATKYLTFVEIADSVTGQGIFDAELQGDVSSLDLGGKLEHGKQYEVEIEFYRIDNSTTAGTGVFVGKQGYIASSSSTIFEIVALTDTAQAPFIVVQPLSQTGTPGSPLSLQVGINEEAFATSTFQWFKNGQEIIGQTGNSLFIPSFDPFGHSGYYKVSVNNGQGGAESISVFVGSTVQFLFIRNEKEFRQQSPSLLSEVGAAFDAIVSGVGITETFPASSISFRKPDNTSLALNFDVDHWEFDSDLLNFTNLNDLRNTFPTGTYRIDIGTDSVAIPFTGTAFPNQPIVSSSVGTWVNGKLRLTATEAASAFTLSTNSNIGNGWSRIVIINATDEEILTEISNTLENPSPSAVAEISASLLSVGQSYEVEADFGNTVERVDVIGPSWAGASTKGYELLSNLTYVTIEIVADPVVNPYTTWQSGFFNPTQLANPAISGDDVDFDNDGIDNLLEFILGGSPTATNSNILKNATTTPAPGGRNLIFFYDRKTVANGISQVIETSPTLTGIWTPAVHGVAGVVISTSTLDAQTERVTATIPSTETKLFVRMKAMR